MIPVPPKALGRRNRADKDNKPKPISGLDVDALLKTDNNRRTRIDPQNAIPEFKQAVWNAESPEGMEEAVRQMGAVIRGIVTDSLGDSGYDRAIEHLGAVRSLMIGMEEPGFYNTFARDFARRLLSGELGGDRRELWWMMKGIKLGLIDSDTSEKSDVTPEQAAEVGYSLPDSPSPSDIQIPTFLARQVLTAMIVLFAEAISLRPVSVCRLRYVIIKSLITHVRVRQWECVM